jgi:Cys-rich protein (TIGR01571 family)
MIDAPTGKWKDSLFNCCSLGICHPSLLCSWCCNSIAMGQIISRVQLTWLGEIGPISRTNQSFGIIVILTICYFIYSFALFFASMSYANNITTDEPLLLHYLRIGGTIFYTSWSIYTLYRIRQNVRIRYQIPEHYCRGCEDICCSVFCSCCTVAQLMRHTGEYETYPGVCCSKTGHPPGTPLVV